MPEIIPLLELRVKFVGKPTALNVVETLVGEYLISKDKDCFTRPRISKGGSKVKA